MYNIEKIVNKNYELKLLEYGWTYIVRHQMGVPII